MHPSGVPPSVRPEDETGAPLLSVVVAAADVENTIEDCLAAFQASTENMAAEIVVVDASRDDTLRRVARFPAVRTITAPPGTLVPGLWLRGLQAGRGRFVAFSTGYCRVGVAWAETMVAALSAGAAGAGGGFTLARWTASSTWAVFFLRYAKFIEERMGSGPIAGDIAADNAAYRRVAIVGIEPGPADGFWEVEIHEALRRRGGGLVEVRGAPAEIAGSARPRRVIAERFRHGRRFGAWRGRTPIARARIVAAAPLVPLILAARAGRQVWPVAQYRVRFIGALPWMLVFAGAWALGEAAGAIAGQSPEDG
jgi:glycosyltransferase involved in cell wall biosynthesis